MGDMKVLSNAKIILIGASTGGPGIIEKLITALPQNFSVPICIVQHFPSELTPSFVARLQTCTSNRVVESVDGLILEAGMIVVAKGGIHLGFSVGDDRRPIIRQSMNGIRHDFIPSVDVMMLSAAEVYEPNSILSILLTGIGDDGADGMVQIKTLGGLSVCQDEKSCAVFGMPGRAIERGGANAVLSVDEIIETIIRFGTR
ncbi:MAG TPA: CheB methylesterase domain-containing protein [Sulfuricurvum sp.]|nr:CheB methylesterase domain-containing protein [Sulfuricurvum sp.]